MINNISPDNTFVIDQNSQGQNIGKEKEAGEMNKINLEHISRLNVPIIIKPENSTFDDVALHAILRQRLSTGTINRNLRYARFMEKHQCPVDFTNPNYENYIRHMDYREQIEGCGWGALKHEHQAMRMFLRAWGIDPDSWPYKPPTRIINQIRKIPSPDQIHSILHIRYKKDNEENNCIKYLVNHAILMGLRNPSELQILKTDDLDIDNGTIKIKMPKLHGTTRLLDIDEINQRHTITSMKNLLIHREKIANHHSNDYLYLRPDGRSFTNPDQMRMYLNRQAIPMIHMIYPEYYNYLSRHINAIMRLIRTKIQTKHYDTYSVMEDMGHTKHETTMTYIKDAKFYYNKYPYDWIRRVLKYHKSKNHMQVNNRCNIDSSKMVEENTSKNNKTIIYLGNVWNFSEDPVRRPPTLNITTEGKNNNKNIKYIVIAYNIQSAFSFFFFSIKNEDSSNKKNKYASYLFLFSKKNTYTAVLPLTKQKNQFIIEDHDSKKPFRNKKNIKTFSSHDPLTTQQKNIKKIDSHHEKTIKKYFLEKMDISSYKTKKTWLNTNGFSYDRTTGENTPLEKKIDKMFSYRQYCPLFKIYCRMFSAYEKHINKYFSPVVPSSAYTNMLISFNILSDCDNHYWGSKTDIIIEEYVIGSFIPLGPLDPQYVITDELFDQIFYLFLVAGKNLIICSTQFFYDFNFLIVPLFDCDVFPCQSPINNKTYNIVCHNILILEHKKNCVSKTILNSVYVMLCYVISYYFYYVLFSLELHIYKLYDIPYSMLCYF